MSHFVGENTELCLGGSFNPIHHGHLITARAAAENLGMGRVRLVVAGDPPHKPHDPSLAPAHDRVAMARLAVSEDDFFVVDDREVRRDGPSFTARTVEELAHDEPVDWLIGSDLLPGLPTWHRAADLLADPPRLVRFHVMARDGDAIDWCDLPPQVLHLRQRQVIVPRVDVSATRLRCRLAAGRSVRYLTPDATIEHIAARGLYRRSQI